MEAFNERLTTSIATSELERRWQVTREWMRDQGLTWEKTADSYIKLYRTVLSGREVS